MTAGDMAVNRCAYCEKQNNCIFVCNDVLMAIYLKTGESPHTINEKMKEAREKMRTKKWEEETNEQM